jgi:hypothetical protein
MSVIPNDETGNDLSSPESMLPVENAMKLDHLLIDINATALPGADDPLTHAETAATAAFHQATLALNVTDVIDLGTESVAGIDALIIRGEQGDTVQLSNEGHYLWSRGENAAAPEGYDIYQAHAMTGHDLGQYGADHAQPVYVLIQHDLTVILDSI